MHSQHPKIVENILLILAGFVIGSCGTLIGAGGGFILVPLLLIFYPELGTERITAISMAVVSLNAISGTVAYAKSGRIDYKAGISFGAFTIPGSILGAILVKYIPRDAFSVVFGVLLVVLALYLFYKNSRPLQANTTATNNKGLTTHTVTDKSGTTFTYSFSQVKGNLISVVVGFISPLLGIGGGIIHVPAMVNWLRFPVHVATATSHFILSVMATVTVITHITEGTYNSPGILKLILLLAAGVVPGAQLGAYFSNKLKSAFILQALSVCLIIVGVRIFIS